MTVAEAITEARSLFNQPDASNSQITDAQLTAWANHYYRQIMIKLGTIPMKEREYTQAETVTLNSNTFTVDTARILVAETSTYRKLEVHDLAWLINQDPDFENTDAGIPQALVRVGTFSVRLWKKPNTANQSSTFKTHGMEFPSALVSGSTPDLPVNLQELFPYWMAYRAFQQLQDTQSANNILITLRSFEKNQKTLSTKFSRERMRWEVE